MKTGMMITLLTILATGHIFSQTALPKPLPVVPADGVAQLEGLIGTGLTAKPVKPRKVLVFSRCEGFVHGEGIVYGIKALEIAARTDAFSATFTIDYAALTDKENLFSYDAVVLNNTTHLKAKDNPALVPNLIEFVTSGRGLCVIHAGADNFYDSPVAVHLYLVFGTVYSNDKLSLRPPSYRRLSRSGSAGGSCGRRFDRNRFAFCLVYLDFPFFIEKIYPLVAAYRRDKQVFLSNGKPFFLEFFLCRSNPFNRVFLVIFKH